MYDAGLLTRRCVVSAICNTHDTKFNPIQRIYFSPKLFIRSSKHKATEFDSVLIRDSKYFLVGVEWRGTLEKGKYLGTNVIRIQLFLCLHQDTTKSARIAKIQSYMSKNKISHEQNYEKKAILLFSVFIEIAWSQVNLRSTQDWHEITFRHKWYIVLPIKKLAQTEKTTSNITFKRYFNR